MQIAPEIVVEERIQDEKNIQKVSGSPGRRNVRKNNRKCNRCRKSTYVVSVIQFNPLIVRRKNLKYWK